MARSATGGFFPLGFGGQTLTGPGAVRFGIVPAHLYNWMCLPPGNATLVTPRSTPAGIGHLGADRNQIIRPFDLRLVPSKVEEAEASWAQLAVEGCERLLHLLTGGIQDQGDFEAER
jgi:hypothetical protein